MTPLPPPPDPDPQHLYRTLPTGGRRTSTWFGIIGAALLLICLPFALPVDRDVVDGDYPTLDEAAVDTVLTWPNWRLDLSALDSQCNAPRLQPYATSLSATCGAVELQLLGMSGVDPAGGDASVAKSANRAFRAAWAQDQEPLNFELEEIAELFAPSMASEIATVLRSDTIEYFYNASGPADSGSPRINRGHDSDGGPDDFGDFGGGFSGDVQDVSYSPASASAASRTAAVKNTRSFYVQTAAFVRNTADHTMYLVIISGDSPDKVESTLSSLLGRLR